MSAHSDQKDQVESLREQLKFSEMARKVLERENTLLNQQVSQGHDQRIEQQKEHKEASKYISMLEGRVLDANTLSLDLLKQVR